MRTGSSIFALLTLVVIGVIVADVVAHPKGTSAVLQGLGEFAKTSYNAMLGHTSNEVRGKKKK